MRRPYVPTLCLAVSCLAAPPVPAHAAPAMGPAQISAEIARTGAKATIVRLARIGQWDGVVTRIGGGSDRWLAVAAELAPGSDAGSAEDLGIGLATALPRNPAGVLRTVSPNGYAAPIGIAHVCGIPFIEQPAREASAYRKQAVAAVRRLREPDLRDRKATCLAALQGTSP